LRLLFIGDIVGPRATEKLAERLPELRRTLGADLVVANAENCATTGPSPHDGFGMTADLVEVLLGAGADVLTSGNHAWDAPDAESVLRNPRVLRPLNVPDGLPGRGVATVQADGRGVTVVNLASRTALPRALPPHEAWSELRESLEASEDTVVVDFHGESVGEKQAFAFAVAGSAAAVFGTHTHEATLDLRVLEGGTALVGDVGMTGAAGGVQGIDPRYFLPRDVSRTEKILPSTVALAEGPIRLGAVFVDIREGRARALWRLEEVL
jgi:2',3'-cyclic-nucleotide 2'-phosphodiesterase